MDFTQILLISYLALFKWGSNHLSDNYFFLFDKIKSYFTTLILSFIHSSTLSLLIFTASAILSTGNPISARESAVSATFECLHMHPFSYRLLSGLRYAFAVCSSSLLYSKAINFVTRTIILEKFSGYISEMLFRFEQ